MKKLNYAILSVDADCHSYVDIKQLILCKTEHNNIKVGIKSLRGFDFVEVDQEELLSAIREEIKSFQEHTNKA